MLVLQRSPDLAVGDRIRIYDPCPPLHGFNGAPTSRSGIVSVRENGEKGLAMASTEPRPRGRGSFNRPAQVLAAEQLQRSPDLAVGDREALAVSQTTGARF